MTTAATVHDLLCDTGTYSKYLHDLSFKFFPKRFYFEFFCAKISWSVSVLVWICILCKSKVLLSVKWSVGVCQQKLRMCSTARWSVSPVKCEAKGDLYICLSWVAMAAGPDEQTRYPFPRQQPPTPVSVSLPPLPFSLFVFWLCCSFYILDIFL